MMHKNTKWAKQILSLQDEEGKWGYFHSLSQDSKTPLTTEQALRRLEILGYTMEDECIQKAVGYMGECLAGKKEIPDRREKLHNWDIFTSMILAAWICRFTDRHALANETAGKWGEIVTRAFAEGEYSRERYVKAYHAILGMEPKGGRLMDFVQFYAVSMLPGRLDPKTEEAVVQYILDKPDGIYYVYDRPVNQVPADFESRQASRYLGALELLARYPSGKKHLGFAVKWLEANRQPNGRWDMGRSVKDGVYFPLSEDWRKRERREADCTERIGNLLEKLGSLVAALQSAGPG